MDVGEIKYIYFEFFHPNIHEQRLTIRFNLSQLTNRMLYTVLPEELCKKLGEPSGIPVRLISTNGRSSEVELWAVGIKYKNRRCTTLAIPSKSKRKIIGFLTLAQLGFTYKFTQIAVYKDQIFNSLLYDFIYDVFDSLYEIKSALDAYREIVKQYNEDFTDVFVNNQEYFLQEWHNSSFITWFMSMYQYSLNTAVILLFLGLYLYVAVAFRQALEGLIAAYVADTRKDLLQLNDPIAKWDIIFNEIRKTGFKNIINKYFRNNEKLANNISSLWEMLSELFIHARGLLHTFTEVSSIAMGLPLVAYVEGDREPLSKLNEAVKSFRKIFRELYNVWSADRWQNKQSYP
jgi:tetratricopeptide (TPR) repeat protein